MRTGSIFAFIALLCLAAFPALAKDGPANPFLTDLFETSAISADGRTVATGDAAGNVKLWDIYGERLVCGFSVGGGGVNALVFTPDGGYVVAVGTGSGAGLYDSASGMAVKTQGGFGRHSKDVCCLAVSADGRRLLTGSADKTIKLWELPSGKLLRTYKGCDSSVTRLFFAPDGGTFLAFTYGKILHRWDTDTGKLLKSYPARSAYPRSVIFGEDGESATIIDAAATSALRFQGTALEDLLWTSTNSFGLHTEKGAKYFRDDSVVPPFSAFPHGTDTRSALACVYKSSIIASYDLGSGGRIAMASCYWDGYFFHYWVPDGSLVTVTDRAVKRWSWPRLELLGAVYGARPDKGSSALAPGAAVYAKAVSPDGKLTALGVDESVELRDSATGRLLKVFAVHGGFVNALAFSADGRRLASGGDDRMVWCWDLATGEPVAAIMQSEYAIACLALNPEGTEVIVGTRGSSNATRLRIEDGKRLDEGYGQLAPPDALAYSPDGKRVFSANYSFYGVSDALSGDFIKKVDTATREKAMALAWSPDGLRLALAFADGRILVLDSESLATLQVIKDGGFGARTRRIGFATDGAGLWVESMDEERKELEIR